MVTAAKRRPAAEHATAADRAARGKAARARSSHGDWEQTGKRPNPIELLEEQAAARAVARPDPLRAASRP
ncbi:MAG: hypothetical protein ACJ760_04180 [Thermoleophilaceae bacterium]